jgi:RNA polymerase sigma-70 factor (ECF subfamily)
MTVDPLNLLVEQAQNGNRAAFDHLVVRFYSKIHSVVMQRLRNSAEADEVTQEVFLRAFRKLPQLQEAERFSGWLSRIAVRLSINRAVRRPAESFLEPEAISAFDAAGDTPLFAMIRQENMEQVRAGLDQLGRLDRETLWAFYFEGSSLKEMSEQFASPIGTIKRRLHTARGRLRDVINGLQPA